MRLTKVTIDHYRSIKHVEICMPERRPLVLFGANNAGKSNIISAIQRALGERWPLNFVDLLRDIEGVRKPLRWSDKSMEVLEGGEEAFYNRQEIYEAGMR